MDGAQQMQMSANGMGQVKTYLGNSKKYKRQNQERFYLFPLRVDFFNKTRKCNKLNKKKP